MGILGAENVLDHVQAFDDLMRVFRDDLAALARHEVRQVVRLTLDDLCQTIEQFRPADSAQPSPGGKRLARLGHGFVGIPLRPEWENADRSHGLWGSCYERFGLPFLLWPAR